MIKRNLKYVKISELGNLFPKTPFVVEFYEGFMAVQNREKRWMCF